MSIFFNTLLTILLLWCYKSKRSVNGELLNLDVGTVSSSIQLLPRSHTPSVLPKQAIKHILYILEGIQYLE